jgi:hypothetical protein
MTSQETNPWYKAKEIILDEYKNGKISDEMDAAQVYAMEAHKDSFQDVLWSRFRANFTRLKKEGFKQKEKKKTNAWQIAKPILHKYYVTGKITDDMSMDQIHAMDEFKQVDKGRLKDNFNRLKKRIKKDQGRADDDLAGYLNDMTIHTLAKDIEGEWHGSKAEKLLREDVENLLHETMRPKYLRLSREEYEQFDLDTFRGHIYQETRRRKESNYWLVKKRKKEKQKQAKLQGLKYTDNDNDFYDPVLQFVSLNDFL